MAISGALRPRRRTWQVLQAFSYLCCSTPLTFCRGSEEMMVWNIIEFTAAKVGGYSYACDAAHPNGTWNEEMGYGRIDAAAALRYARDNHTTYKLERPSWEYALAVQILLGLIQGGGGVVLPPGGPPVPVDPRWQILAPRSGTCYLGWQ
jgi:hypothetical protein